MRVSVDNDDAGYLTYGMLRGGGKEVRVFLNGIERDYVVTADEEQRLIVRMKTDERGMPIIDRTKEEIVHETLKGDVFIDVYEVAA